jgi:RNA polymerase sigma-70 factor (ECF subfamily)
MLQAIALRMVGCLADAEDIVQDTFVKWLTADRERIVNTKAYLIRSVMNNCLNHLNSLKERKKQYIESISAKDHLAFYKELEIPKIDFEQELSAAWALIQTKLEPMERTVYVLREVFEVDYEELQEILDKKKENCRQLFSRAKKRLEEEAQKFKVDMSRHAVTLESFKKSCDLGNPSELINEMMKDISIKLNGKMSV